MRLDDSDGDAMNERTCLVDPDAKQCPHGFARMPSVGTCRSCAADPAVRDQLHRAGAAPSRPGPHVAPRPLPRCPHRGERVKPDDASDCHIPERYQCTKLNRPMTACQCRKCPPGFRPVTASVVLATLNEPDLVETVRCLWDWNGVDEVVIVDDGSTDDSLGPFAAACKKYGGNPTANPYTVDVPRFPPIRVVHNATRQGVSRSLNIGVRHAAGDVVIIYSGHMRGSGQNLRTLARVAFERNAIVQSASLGMGQDTRMHGWGCRWTEHDEKLFDLRWNTKQPADEYAEVAGLMGACYAIPAHLYRRLGGFADQTGLWGFLEGFLSLKANLAGVPILASRDIFTRHLYRKPKDRAFDLPQKSVWLSRFAGLRIALEPDTFQLVLPELKARYWHPDIGTFLASPEVEQEHRVFQAIRQVSDAEWFGAHLSGLWGRWHA